MPFVVLVGNCSILMSQNNTNDPTGSFAPVTLEQLARESGVLRSDGVTPCLQAAAKEGTSRLTRLLARAAESADDKDQCIIRPFGRETSTSSFALYTFSIAVLLQALVLITFSPVADYGI
jgi:UMF1 family MFS transporter